MGSIERRIEYLEQHIRPPEKDKDAALRRALMLDILDEVASLKASRALSGRNPDGTHRA
jgi:hypothetical protein